MFKKMLVVLFFILSTSAWALTWQDYYQAGGTFYAQGKYNLSIRCYQAVVQANPQCWQAYQALGASEYKVGQKDAAIRDFQTCLSLNPNNPGLQSFLNSISAASLSAVPVATPALSTPVVQTQTHPEANNALPKEGSVTWNVTASADLDSYDDLANYYGQTLINQDIPVGVAVALGADYTIVPQFQVGLNIEGIYKLAQPVSFTEPSYGVTINDQWTDICLGPSLDVKYLIPLDRQLNFITHGELGYYFLTGAMDVVTVTGSTPSVGTYNVSGSNIGGLLEVEMEWLQPSGVAFDLGLGYRLLTFNQLNFTYSNTFGQTGAGAFEANNGALAYMDFSGPHLSAAIRFF